MRHVVCFALTCWISSGSLASDLPPVGSREYIIDLDSPENPTVIQAQGAKRIPSGAARMRDPILRGGVKKNESVRSLPATQAPKQVSRMRFERTLVKGRYLVPRVTFERPVLPSDRREEPVGLDYRQRIRESEGVLKDFEW